MFKKFVIAFVGLMLCSSCFAEGGMPDANDWFIQQLTAGGPPMLDIQISDVYAVWRDDYDVKYYDGTGIYDLRYAGTPCYSPSLSESSIVCVATGGILYYSQGYKRLIPTNQPYFDTPDVYGNSVVWAAGPNYNQLNVYYNDGFSTTCLTNNPQCFNNGFNPKIALNSIAWLSFDGNDDEVFISENGVICQLTYNDVDEYDLSMSDNGHLAWNSWHDSGHYGYYYDGSHIWQMTVGDYDSHVCGISEKGVLYYVNEDYSELNKVVFFDGINETVLFQSNYNDGIFGASMGGNSISWIGRVEVEPYKLYFLKGEELLSWSPGSWSDFNATTAVWGNRLIWPIEGNYYFGEQDSPACVKLLKMDGNGDCQVNLQDFIIFASEWLDCGYSDPSACQQ